NLRIEHRLAGADANPYLVLAAILTGMEHGLVRGVEPIAPLNDNRQSGIDFPKDALSALAAMRHHPVVNEGLGSEFVMVYCENKYQEQLDFMRHIDAREYRWFL
ncbi:MAG: glutamine synthetase, partial [Pseudomonas sp.]